MKIRLLTFFILMSSFAFAQMNTYNFKREIKSNGDVWQKITLPDEMYGKIQDDLSDVRIFGINAQKDTIEAAYLWSANQGEILKKQIPFQLINQSSTAAGTYFTFEIPQAISINEINLDLKDKNFDWKVKLEGSNDQKEWFTILKNYRIVGIKNTEVGAFTFTKLKFPDAKFQYYRVFINSKNIAVLNSASVLLNESNAGILQNHQIASQKVIQNKIANKTVVEINLKMPVPVNYIKVNTLDSFDFYRPISIEYAVDSLQTGDGYQYQYVNIGSGILNSLDKNEFQVEKTTAKKFRLTIDNFNNPVLKLSTIEIKGFKDQMDVRFLEKANYFLVYGKKNAQAPQFDLSYFKEKIPDNIPEAALGAEMPVDKNGIHPTEALFKNKVWLWIIMALIIILLGGFTLKMMKKED